MHCTAHINNLNKYMQSALIYILCINLLKCFDIRYVLNAKYLWILCRHTHINYVKTDGKSIIISYVFIYTLKCANAFHQEDYV